MGSNSEPFVASLAWGLFFPGNGTKPNEKTPVGEEESNVSLELSLLLDHMHTAIHKRNEETNCREKRTETLSSELISNVSSKHSLSKDYISLSKGNRFEGDNCLKPKDGGVSLVLNLGFNDTCTASKKRQRMENICSGSTATTTTRRVSSSKNKRIKVDKIVSSCKNKRVIVDEIVSTELRLGRDPWCIKKRLTESDLGNMSRLLLESKGVKSHVFPFWNADQLAKIKEGLSVLVWDCDTKSEYELVFKQWNNGAYVLIKNWVKHFVNRRELKLGDAIGLYWDNYTSTFKFAVLDQVASH